MSFYLTVNDFLGRLFENVVLPGFRTAAEFMDAVILGPLQAAGIPSTAKITIIGLLTWAVSSFLNRLLRMERQSQEFRTTFTKEKDDWTAAVAAAPNPESRSTMLGLRDSSLDHLYNNYLAGLFVRNGVAYLLPVLLVLLWLDSSIPAAQMKVNNSPGLFLLTFGAAHLGHFFIKKKQGDQNG